MSDRSSSKSTGPDQAPRPADPASAASKAAAANDVPMGVALSPNAGESGTVTRGRPAGSARWRLDVDLRKVGVQAALQHLAKAINIAFQTDYGENYLESVYQAAIVKAR